MISLFSDRRREKGNSLLLKQELFPSKKKTRAVAARGTVDVLTQVEVGACNYIFL
jgi:hypothetical protein